MARLYNWLTDPQRNPKIIGSRLNDEFDNIFSSFRVRLTANLTLYVRKDGSDSNTGLADTAAGAFLTITKAINVLAANYDLGGAYSITIQVGDGTYAENLTLAGYVGFGTLGQPTAIIQGNASNHNAVLLSPASGNTITAVGVATPWAIKNLKITSDSQGVEADLGSVVYLSGVNFGACNIGVQALYGSTIEFSSVNYTIAGAMAVAEYAQLRGIIIHQGGATVTISGTPAFSAFFAYAADLGAIYAVSTTYSGAATGTRFLVSTNGVIQTGGAGGNLFPGNAAGSTDTGGQYA